MGKNNTSIGISTFVSAMCIGILSTHSVFSDRAIAATINKSESENCVISIVGEITDGDFDNFVEMSTALFPGNNGESTSGDTVCLSSPGGNLREAVKFAKHFYKEGVGTVIEADSACYSACAVMFMMGVATGAEVSFVNRKLHVKAKLGFHRPYIQIEADELIEAKALAVAYDVALQAALDLIAIANSQEPWSSSPMMKPDLIQAMLHHVGSNMFLIDTVDEVGRWNIELIGVEPVKILTEEQAFYACENSLQWQSGVTKDDITYTAAVASPYEGYKRVKSIETSKGSVFEIEGLDAGYAAQGCVISSDGTTIQGCGIDEYTSSILGGGACDPSNYASRREHIGKLSIFNPATNIALLGDPPKKGPPLDSVSSVRCVVLQNFALVDDERCTVDHFSTEAKEVTHYLWPSGAKTVLVKEDGRLAINGVPTSSQPVPRLGTCYFNSETFKDFCVSR